MALPALPPQPSAAARPRSWASSPNNRRQNRWPSSLKAWMLEAAVLKPICHLSNRDRRLQQIERAAHNERRELLADLGLDERHVLALQLDLAACANP